MPFPRPRGRGSVEAVFTLYPPPRLSNFRARAGAAPLKRFKNVILCLFYLNFRARAGAAPLKPGGQREHGHQHDISAPARARLR